MVKTDLNVFSYFPARRLSIRLAHVKGKYFTEENPKAALSNTSVLTKENDQIVNWDILATVTSTHQNLFCNDIRLY